MPMELIQGNAMSILMIKGRSHGVALWSKSGEWNALVTLRKSLFTAPHQEISSLLQLSPCVFVVCMYQLFAFWFT